MWMLSEHFRALTEKFKELTSSLKKGAPKRARNKAWNAVIQQFIDVEIPDFLELININILMLNPLAARKVELFQG
jgi:hypothetical protein